MILLVNEEPLGREKVHIMERVHIMGADSIGESLFTLFASLTYAYHYLMTLIK